MASRRRRRNARRRRHIDKAVATTKKASAAALASAPPRASARPVSAGKAAGTRAAAKSRHAPGRQPAGRQGAGRQGAGRKSAARQPAVRKVAARILRTQGDDAGIRATWSESHLGVKALLVGIFVNRLGAFVQIFLVLFLTMRGFSTVQAGGALGFYATGSVVGVIIGGTLTDRLGPRRTILMSMSGTAVLILAILYLRYYPALLGAVAIVGAVGGAYRPASKTLLSELTPKHRQVMIFAMYRLAYNLGTTAAPLIGAALVAVSYDLLFWGEAAATLIYVVIAAIALPKRRPTEDASTTTEAEKEGAAGYLAVLADRRFALFLLATLINSVVYVQYLSTLPVAMRAAGLSATWFGAMVALNGFIVITCELLATKVVQRWPMRIVVAVGFALLGGGLACYALPFGAAVFIVGTLIWSLAEIVAGPTMFAYPAVAGPDRLRGRYLGSSTAMFGIGAAIGPVAGLTVWNLAGKAVWGWCAAVCAVGIAVAWFGMRPAAETGDTPDAGTGADTAEITAETTVGTAAGTGGDAAADTEEATVRAAGLGASEGATKTADVAARS